MDNKKKTSLRNTKKAEKPTKQKIVEARTNEEERKIKTSAKPIKPSEKHAKQKGVDKPKTKLRDKTAKKTDYFYKDGNVKPEHQEKLYAKIFEETGFSEKLVMEAYEKFHHDYPVGKITKEEFIDQSDVDI
jgi:hypothetical protein